MKKSILLLSIILLAFSASAQGYIGMGLIGAGTNMLLLPGLNPCLLATASPSLLPALIYAPSPIITPHIVPNLLVIPNTCAALLPGSSDQTSSSVLVVGIQSSTTTSTHDTLLAIITNMR